MAWLEVGSRADGGWKGGKERGKHTITPRACVSSIAISGYAQDQGRRSSAFFASVFAFGAVVAGMLHGSTCEFGISMIIIIIVTIGPPLARLG